MAEDNTEVKDSESIIIDKWKNGFYFIVPFSVVAGCIYLFGFWSVFGVNILQFAGIADVVASAMLPMLVFVAAMFSGFLLARILGHKFLFKSVNKSTSSSVESVNEEASNLPNIRRRLMVLRVSMWCIGILYGIFLLLSILLDLPFKWPLCSMAAALALSFFIESEDVKIIPYCSQYSQSMLIFFAFAVLIGAFGSGRTSGVSQREGHFFYYVVSASNPVLSPKGRIPETAMRYIGHVSDYDFFYDPVQKSTLIVKVQKENFIEVRDVSATPIPIAKKIQDTYRQYFGTEKK